MPASKPNRRLTGGSVRFCPVSIVLNNDNRPEPDGTAGQPAVGFWSLPLASAFSKIKKKKKEEAKSRRWFRAVASLTVPGGQEFHFPHFFLKFQSIFPQTVLISFIILPLRVGESPTREGPGYATALINNDTH